MTVRDYEEKYGSVTSPAAVYISNCDDNCVLSCENNKHEPWKYYDIQNNELRPDPSLNLKCAGGN